MWTEVQFCSVRVSIISTGQLHSTTRVCMMKIIILVIKYKNCLVVMTSLTDEWKDI
jgi:hypothetical protein